MLTALIVLSIIYQVVAASVTVLSMMCPSVVYVNHSPSFKHEVSPVVYVNSPSHSCKHKVPTSRLC